MSIGRDRSTTLHRKHGYFESTFVAMGSPCELLARTDDGDLARVLIDVVAGEAWRIEDKFSRYIADSVVERINSSNGEAVEVDEETANLLDFAASLFAMSDGQFDITSGVLRKAWKFDGGDRVPDGQLVKSILDTVGWGKVDWQRPFLTMQRGMQLDFGGIGKEYAVDKAAGLVAMKTDASVLLNFGGDIVASGSAGDFAGWKVGIEALQTNDNKSQRVIRLTQGALATSGDARRFILRDGVRYGHILDPTTGWPVTGAPRSVNVAADTCTQAGMLATFAMLSGKDAEKFLESQDLQFWCQR